jgi:drug/metabolite transporter (DMT)-like permease
MGIAYGLLAAFCWGLGDFLITSLTRRAGTPRAMFAIQILSLASWALLLLLLPRHSLGGVNVWLLAVGTGIFHVAALQFTYKAFEIGTLALVSPIISGFAVVTAVLSLISGERPPALALLGTALLIAGVVLATRAPLGSTQRTLAGVPQAVMSALAFGIMFWLFAFVEPQLGFVWPMLLLKTMASASGFWSLIAGDKTSSDSEPVPTLNQDDNENVTITAKAGGMNGAFWLLALGAAAADTFAWLAFIFGTRTEFTSIVTALASLFSAVTVLLAWAFLRDRLAINQWMGVAIILMGVLLVSI